MTTRNALLGRRELLRRAGLALGAGMLMPALGSCGDPNDGRLSFANWQDYIDDALLGEFSDRTGLVVTYETYASNDELSGRLSLADATRRRGREGSSFDLIVPSDNLLKRLRNLSLLQELDDATVGGGLANLDDAFRQLAVDPGNRFSIPWATGTTGIGYDTTVFPEPPDWTVFADDTHRDRMTLLDETRDAFAVALFLAGDDPNSTDEGAIAEATATLQQMASVIRGFDSAGYLDGLASGDLVCAHAYSSDVLQAREQNPDLAFVIPTQGGLRWIDSLCVPESAPNPAAANQFIAYYLEPEVSASNSVAIKADTGNREARRFLADEVLADSVVFPDDSVRQRLAVLEDLGEVEDLYAEQWALIKGE